MIAAVSQSSSVRIARLAWLVMSATLFGCFVGSNLGGMGRGFEFCSESTLKVFVLAVTAWGLASLAGIAVLGLVSRGSMERLGLAVMASSTVRMLAGLVMGLTLFLLMRPEGTTFWIGILVAGLLTLLAETGWAIKTIRAADHGIESSRSHVG